MDMCCTRAVFDDQAGWWCPWHGDPEDWAEHAAAAEPTPDDRDR